MWFSILPRLRLKFCGIVEHKRVFDSNTVKFLGKKGVNNERSILIIFFQFLLRILCFYGTHTQKVHNFDRIALTSTELSFSTVHHKI